MCTRNRRWCAGRIEVQKRVQRFVHAVSVLKYCLLHYCELFEINKYMLPKKGPKEKKRGNDNIRWLGDTFHKLFFLNTMFIKTNVPTIRGNSNEIQKIK